MAEQRDDGPDEGAATGQDGPGQGRSGPDVGGQDASGQDRSARGTSEHGPAVAGLGYEQARDELVDVVRRLEAGGEPLEASLALWERGEALAARCQEWLNGARARLDAAREPTAER